MAGILLDVDGVLHVSGHPILGGAKAIARLREDGHRLRFVTNNTTHSRSALAEEIRSFGVVLEDEETEATVLGKPSAAYFAAALDALDYEPERTWMVGDDVEADVGGASAFGLRSVLVRTGKFREEELDEATVKPDGVIDSISALPDWLEARA